MATAIIVALVLSYLIGSVPTAYLVAKRQQGVDIRTVGSGNVGATNVWRTIGRKAGAVVFLADALKGLLAATLIPLWVIGARAPAWSLACGGAAVVGHLFPCFLRFRGGKGVATTIGVLVGDLPSVAAVVIVAWMVVFAISRYVSVSSLVAAVLIPVSQLTFRQPWPDVLLGSAIALLIVLKHRSNIQRLLAGREHRFSAKPSTPAAPH